jgi:hypothetical protein
MFDVELYLRAGARASESRLFSNAMSKSTSSSSSSSSSGAVTVAGPRIVSSKTTTKAASAPQAHYDAAARILELQERERIARARELSRAAPQQADLASKQFEAAALILKLQEERTKLVDQRRGTLLGFELTRLPLDVQVHVFVSLPAEPAELCRLALVCKSIRELVSRNYVWHMLALEMFHIIDQQQRPRKGESWRSYFIETFRMLRMEGTFQRVAVERGLVRVVRSNMARFTVNAVDHLCCAIQHRQVRRRGVVCLTRDCPRCPLPAAYVGHRVVATRARKHARRRVATVAVACCCALQSARRCAQIAGCRR